MLQEYPSKQVEGDYPRRWFSDESMDLFVWFDGNGEIHGFQLCYDKSGAEKALTWLKDGPIRHEHVDGGETHVLKNASPVLASASHSPIDHLLPEFDLRSPQLPTKIRALVLESLRNFNS